MKGARRPAGEQEGSLPFLRIAGSTVSEQQFLLDVAARCRGKAPPADSLRGDLNTHVGNSAG